jgi:hypothetical protein
MKMLIARLLVFTLFATPSVSVCADLSKSTYELVLAGKVCQEEQDNQQLNCDYRIGKDLHFTVVGVGLPDTGITFIKSSFEGDFYATYGLQHGCVIVKRGKQGRSTTKPGLGSFADYAFVSPRNGKVYQSWRECKDGM